MIVIISYFNTFNTFLQLQCIVSYCCKYACATYYSFVVQGHILLKCKHNFSQAYNVSKKNKIDIFTTLLLHANIKRRKRKQDN